jgi:hypothetical protein
LRSYKSVQNQVTAARRALAGLTFDDKNCLPLAAADQFAYTAWGEKVGQSLWEYQRSQSNPQDRIGLICLGSI